MKLRIFPMSAIVLATIISSNPLLSQNLHGQGEQTLTAASFSKPLPLPASSSVDTADSESPAAAYVRPALSGAIVPKSFRPFSQIGVDTHIGLGGAGFDIATPLSKHFNVRVGSDFFSYSTNFQEQGANVAVNLHMQSGHGSLDWFPFGGALRLSPQVVFANNNRVLATALIPSGSTVTLNGQNYISSLTDPLRGGGSVEFRRVSPGFSLGFGNIIPREGSRFSIPIELGFYYVGQPGLKVNFTGSACDPTQPPSIGCQSVSQDPSFKQNLSAFIARNNHNLSYASFFPIFSIGFGHSF